MHVLIMQIISRTLLRLFGICALNIAVFGAEQLYQLEKEIQIAGEMGWDYLAADSAAHRLYVSHGTKVVVIDTEKGAVVGEIPDTPGVHGFAIASELGRGFSSNGRESKVSIVELPSLKLISKVATGENPDAILYEPSQKEVYAFNGRGRSATVINASNGEVVQTVSLPGKPEFAVVDVKAGRIYNNIEDKSMVAVIDTKSHQVVNQWPIAPGEEASGMAIDLVNHRLFLGCNNKLMVMMDSENGKVVATVPIGGRVDANAFDPETKLAFSSNGEGNVTIAREESPDKLTVVQTLTTQPGAKTMALDTKTHKIYLAAVKYAPAEGAQRPKALPGTFKVLVYKLVDGGAK
jgi:DNA-binding beta-propeller fold protein YncE